MKNNVITFTYGVFVIVCILVIAMLIVVMVDTAEAKSINQREWLLEYEQVSGYPAPSIEPIVTATATATTKPTKQKPKPTIRLTPTFAPTMVVTPRLTPTFAPTMVITPRPTFAPTMDVKPKDQECISEASDEWWREKRKGQAWFITKDGVTTYCFGYPPIPFYEGTPDPPREGEIPENGYPAPPNP